EAWRVAFGIDAAAVEADVDFDEHVEHAAGAPHRLRPPARDFQMVDDDRDRGAIHQRDQSRRVRRAHRVRQADVVDAGADEHLRFTDLRAADADGAAIDLPRGDDGRLVGLGMWTQPKSRGRSELLHALDVTQRAHAIDQDLWGR